ncbi:MAG: DUF2164 domain-containing protein [Candidatus Afipia apatlaquensis]|uniref:DUF2164 domain-containing protein n=1 Tax=Candidatus Afipia apatlaquensis TaxID=2712852 RepID=A0A7C9RGI1_9BRAD|nr:DUF2164 domain-containing protein [Candidatus Afipia apatlaquensis]
MKNMVLSKDDRVLAIQSIKNYFEKERDDAIGDLSASLLLDFITDEIGPLYYNMAIADACKFMSGCIEDMYGLEKSAR